MSPFIPPGTANGNGAPAATPPPSAPPPTTETAALPTTVDAQQQPMQTLPVNTMPRESWGRSVYHGVLSALGGTNQVSMTRDPKTGQMIATQARIGPGQQWKNIIAGALTGYGAAAATGAHGPGSTSAKIGAGIQAGQQRVQQQYDQKRAEANEDFATQQKAATQNAQNALLATRNAQDTFNLGRSQVTASVEDTQRENTFGQVLAAGGQGSQDIGVFHDFGEVMQAFKDDPRLHDHLAGGRLVSIPHVADGKVDGIHVALVTDDWLNAKIDKDLPISVQEYKDGKLQTSTFTIPAGSLTGDQYVKMIGQQSAESLKQYGEDLKAKQAADKQDLANRKEGAQEGLWASQEARNYAAANKDKKETQINPASSDVGQDAVEGLATGRYIMGKDFPTRTTKDQAQAKEYSAGANQYSMQHYGLPFNPQVIRQEDSFAHDRKTQSYLDAIDGMVGDPASGAAGQLDQVLDAARAAGLGKRGPGGAQMTWQDIKSYFGSKAAAGFEQMLSDTQTRLGTLVGNPLLGSGESDQKLRTAKEQFGKNMNMEQLETQVANAKMVLENSRKSLAHRNRFIQQRYGGTYSPPQAPQMGGAGAQPGAAAAAPPPPAAANQAPPVSLLKEGVDTKFKGGMGTWTLQNGKAVRVGD